MKVPVVPAIAKTVVAKDEPFFLNVYVVDAVAAVFALAYELGALAGKTVARSIVRYVTT